MNAQLIVRAVMALCVLCATSAHGQYVVIPPGNPPAWLPSGPALHHWVVTNRPCNVPVTIEYTTKNGELGTRQNSGALTNFPTYEAFQRYVASEGMRLVNAVKTNASATAPVRCYLMLLYQGLSYNYGLSVNVANIGSTSQISSNSFIGLPPLWEAGIVPVNGLQRFTVEVSEPAYRFTWTPNGTSIAAQAAYPQERTTTDLIVLNAWYATNSSAKVRYTVVAGNATNIYTQVGSTIAPPIVKMLSGSRLHVSMSPGSETTVEATEDFVSWQKVATFYGSNTSFDIDHSAPRRFFRAYSN